MLINHGIDMQLAVHQTEENCVDVVKKLALFCLFINYPPCFLDFEDEI